MAFFFIKKKKKKQGLAKMTNEALEFISFHFI